jgi:hypothetical protein
LNIADHTARCPRLGPLRTVGLSIVLRELRQTLQCSLDSMVGYWRCAAVLHRADVRLTAKILHPHWRAALPALPAVGSPLRCPRYRCAGPPPWTIVPVAAGGISRPVAISAWRNAGGDRHRPFRTWSRMRCSCHGARVEQDGISVRIGPYDVFGADVVAGACFVLAMTRLRISRRWRAVKRLSPIARVAPAFHGSSRT